MKRRSFLALLGLAPVAAHVVSKTAVAPVDGSVSASGRFRVMSEAIPAGARTHIGMVTTGTLKSANGRMVLDLGAGSITFT